MITYLSLKELAQRIGVKPATASRYKLPDPDALIGDVRGWLPESVDAWNENRPGHGGRPRTTTKPPSDTSTM